MTFTEHPLRTALTDLDGRDVLAFLQLYKQLALEAERSAHVAFYRAIAAMCLVEAQRRERVWHEFRSDMDESAGELVTDIEAAIEVARAELRRAAEGDSH